MLSFDPTGWGETFQEEKNNLQYYLKGFKVAINHIGATAYKNGRSNRNVDILVTVESLADLTAVVVRLQSKGYKLVNYEEGHECSTLVVPKKVLGYGVTIKVMLYASEIFNKYNAFITLVKEHEHLVRHYNEYRDELTRKCGRDWKSYRKLKIDYINLLLEEHFKFE